MGDGSACRGVTGRGVVIGDACGLRGPNGDLEGIGPKGDVDLAELLSRSVSEWIVTFSTPSVLT